MVSLKALRPAVGVALVILLASARASAVDGVVEINDARAAVGGVTPGDLPGYPVSLTRAGSYRLTSDLYTGDTGITAVEVTVDGVTLDLNGFEIACAQPGGICSASGVLGRGVRGIGRSAVTVRNGAIRSLKLNAVALGARAEVENLVITATGSFVFPSVDVGENSIVRLNVVQGGGGDGIRFAAGSLILDNVVSGNAGTGFPLIGGGGGSVIRGNSVTGNAVGGFGFAPSDGYSGNVFVGNGAGESQGVGGAQIGANFCGTDTSCP